MELISASALVVGGGIVTAIVRVGVHSYGEVQRGREVAERVCADENALGFRDATGRLF